MEKGFYIGLLFWKHFFFIFFFNNKKPLSKPNYDKKFLEKYYWKLAKLVVTYDCKLNVSFWKAISFIT